MKLSIRKGLGFGLTSGIITTLGLIIGLYSSTNSKAVVLAGILVIAIADALSDGFGVHISEESGSKSITTKEIWENSISTFFFKFIFAIIFIIPILLLSLKAAVITGIILGLILLTLFSYYIAKQHRKNPTKVIIEHLIIAIIVIIITYYIGKFSATLI